MSSKFSQQRNIRGRPSICISKLKPILVPPPITQPPWDHVAMDLYAYWPEESMEYYGTGMGDAVWIADEGAYILEVTNDTGEAYYRVVVNQTEMTCAIYVKFTDLEANVGEATETAIPIPAWDSFYWNDYVNDIMNPNGEYYGDAAGHMTP